MRLVWTRDALVDLARLHEFLAAVNPSAAAKVVDSLSVAPERLIELPRLGERIEQFGKREVRRIIVGRYEMRYEIAGSSIVILHLWQTRENR